MAKLLCKLLGHRHRPYDYGTIRVGATDGVGRVHGSVWYECDRCDEKFLIVQVHIPITEPPAEVADGE